MVLDDLAKLVNVGGPQVSPDGQWIAYTASHVDVGEDKNVSELWMVSWDGTQNVHLTYGPEGAGSPRWSPDGKDLAFVSFEGKYPQLFVVAAVGGKPRQLTRLAGAVYFINWGP